MLLAMPTGPVPPASLVSGQPLHAGEWLAELPLLQCCPGSETFHPCLLSLARSSTFKRNFPEPHPSSPLPSALLRPGFNSHQSPEKLLVTCLPASYLLQASRSIQHGWSFLPLNHPLPLVCTLALRCFSVQWSLSFLGVLPGCPHPLSSYTSLCQSCFLWTAGTQPLHPRPLCIWWPLGRSAGIAVCYVS